jgi:hypothetical protein
MAYAVLSSWIQYAAMWTVSLEGTKCDQGQQTVLALGRTLAAKI